MSNLNASEATKEKEFYVYAICHDIPFDIGRVINEDILECMERAKNTTLGFPSLITELYRLSQVPIKGNEEKTLHPMPLSIKSLKSKPRKSVRRQVPRDVPSYDSGREASEEEGEKETVEAKEEEEKGNEMPPLGH